MAWGWKAHMETFARRIRTGLEDRMSREVTKGSWEQMQATDLDVRQLRAVGVVVADDVASARLVLDDKALPTA